MTPIDRIRQLAHAPVQTYPILEGSNVKHARLMFLEFITILLALPIEQVNLLVGGTAGFLMLVQLYDALSGGPSQDGKNSRNLN
jgi:hypothetical protein